MKHDIKHLMFNYLVINEQILDRQQIWQNRLHQAITIFSLTGQLTSGLGEAVDMIQLDFGKFFDMATHNILKRKTREM